jgi:hypothetical protein
MIIEKKSFLENGYIIYSPNYSIETLKKSQEEFKKILYKCEKKEYEYVRVYDDYSNKINIAGIEMIFDKDLISQSIINLVQESEILSVAKNLLEDQNLIMTLSRFHVTKKFSHIGIWHRDGEPNRLDSVQVNIYIFDETGMQIVPESHKRNNLDIEKNILKKSLYKNLPKQKFITIKSGQACAFHPSLLHRGISSKDRAHLHFRFVRKKDILSKKHEIDKRYLSNFTVKDDLFNLLNNSLDYENRFLQKKNNFILSFKLTFVRTIRFFIHKFLFFLPLGNKLFGFFNVRPCLKIRSLFFFNI